METPAFVPDCIRATTEGCDWLPSTDGASGASVYRLVSEAETVFFAKHGNGMVANGLIAEVDRLNWLAPLLPVPRVHGFFHSPRETWLLTTAIPGRSAYDCLLENSTGRLELVRSMAAFLRRLHALPARECPFNSDHLVTMAAARVRIESQEVDESDFDSRHQGWTAEQVWTEMLALLPLPFDRVVTHGDFSLDNLLVQDDRITGCIDLGRAGIADPYQDLAVLSSNLEEFGEDLQAGFFKAYGIGEPDARKIRFHLCLDEFF